VLEKLLQMAEIRHAMGDRVFDVIGQLQLNDIRFEEMVREATYAKASEDEVLEQIEQLDPKHRRIRASDWRSTSYQSCGFVQDSSHSRPRLHFPRATVDATLCREFLSGLVSFKAKSGDSRRWIVAHPYVKEEFRSGNLMPYGGWEHLRKTPKLTFYKEHLAAATHQDADLISWTSFVCGDRRTVRRPTE